MSKSSINIFTLLKFLDENEMQIYKDFSEDKEVLADLTKNIGWLLPQWMSAATNDKDHRLIVSKVNEIANLVWLGTSGNPELQTKLLATCGLGRAIKHKFYKPTGRKSDILPLLELLRNYYCDISEPQVGLWCRTNDINTLERIAEQCGYQPKDQKPLMDSYHQLNPK